ncbi:MAG: thiamine phosphate synthase, partial [Dehalococcoidia bacterium]
ALACEADGVHLAGGGAEIGESDLPPTLLLGRSVHSLDAARRAEAEGADYLVLGTIFPSRSHPGVLTGGTALVAEVSRVVAVPVIAIGGIATENAGAVIEAGASGVAVISAIFAATEPRAAAAALVSVIERRRPSAVGERE